jgi:RimJ/RimL family protein N-acetyltransferase
MSFFSRLTNKPTFRIVDTDCILQPLSSKDIKIVRNWFEDKDLVKHAFGIIADEQALKKVSKDYLQNFFSSSTEILGIITQETKLAGFINYTIIRYRESAARIGILLGEEKHRSKGLGTKAMNIALLYLFDRRNLERIDLDTAFFNTRAQKCFQKCGFRRVRETTELNFLTGEMVHKILMELYREDYFKELYKRFDTLPTFEGLVPESRYIQKVEK